MLNIVNDEMKKAIVEAGKNSFLTISEITFDSFLQEGFLKELPVVGSVFSAMKIGKTVSDYFFAKKLTQFIKGINCNNDNQVVVQEFINKFSMDEKYANQITNHIMITIERLDKEQKAEIFAKLFIAYVCHKYTWDEFIYHSTALEQIFMADFLVMRKLISVNNTIQIDEIAIKNFKKDIIRGSVERFKSIGYLDVSQNSYEALENYSKSRVSLSSTGSKFYNLCVHGVDC